MKFRAKLKRLFRRRAAEAEMSDEIRLHLELQTERNVAAGMDPDEARYAAQRAFGGVEQVKEQCREQRSVVWLEQLGRDLGYAARGLRHAPMFTAVAVATLALAVGANSLLVSLLNGFLLKPVLPRVATPAVHVFAVTKSAARAPQGFTRADVDVLRANPAVFATVGALSVVPMPWGPDSLNLRHGMVEIVAGDFFTACGVRPALGRFFGADATARSAEVVVSHEAWRALGGDSAVLGRSIVIEGQRFTVVGVAPRGFGGPVPLMSADVWIPARPGPDVPLHALIARLAPGLDLAGATARLAPIEAQLNASAAEGRARELLLASPSMFVMPGRVDRLSHSLLWGGRLFLALGAVLLVIASLNLANMQLARGAARAHEIAVRLALGAARGRVVRLLMGETLLLAAAGSALGLALAAWASAGLQHWVTRTITQKTGWSVSFDFSLDPRVVAATCGYATLMMLAVGIVPALRSTRVDVIGDLGGKASSLGRRVSRLIASRPLLVVGQITCSFVLIVCAGLFVGFVERVQQVDFGFDVEHNLVFALDYELSGRDPIWARPEDNLATTSARRLPLGVRRADYARELRQHRTQAIERIAALPGVRQVAVASSVIFPLGDSNTLRLRAVAGAETDDGGGAVQRAVETAVSRHYFTALGIPISAGRGFSADEEDSGRPVVLLDDQVAGRLFPGENPIGQQVVFVSPAPGVSTRPYEVIGIVRSPPDSIRFSGRPLRVYRTLRAREAEGWSPKELFVHVAVAEPGAAASILGAVQQELVAIDPTIPARSALRMRDHIAANPAFSMLRFTAGIFGSLGAIGLLVAMVGIFGVKAYTVTRRTREIGVRLALGAEPGQVRRLFLREGAAQTLLALALGWLVAVPTGLALSRVFTSVRSFDLRVAAGATVLLGGAALLACWLPARRAAKVDPIVALRCE